MSDIIKRLSPPARAGIDRTRVRLTAGTPRRRGSTSGSPRSQTRSSCRPARAGMNRSPATREAQCRECPPQEQGSTVYTPPAEDTSIPDRAGNNQSQAAWRRCSTVTLSPPMGIFQGMCVLQGCPCRAQAGINHGQPILPRLARPRPRTPCGDTPVTRPQAKSIDLADTPTLGDDPDLATQITLRPKPSRPRTSR